MLWDAGRGRREEAGWKGWVIARGFDLTVCKWGVSRVPPLHLFKHHGNADGSRPLPLSIHDQSQ